VKESIGGHGVSLFGLTRGFSQNIKQVVLPNNCLLSLFVSAFLAAACGSASFSEELLEV
jgi:hypothetical protein